MLLGHSSTLGPQGEDLGGATDRNMESTQKSLPLEITAPPVWVRDGTWEDGVCLCCVFNTARPMLAPEPLDWTRNSTERNKEMMSPMLRLVCFFQTPQPKVVHLVIKHPILIPSSSPDLHPAFRQN